LFQLFANDVLDTNGKFTAPVVPVAKLAAGVIETVANLPLA
jgi:hypothetical protein